jgi:dipeptide transport system ATP-binding protein
MGLLPWTARRSPPTDGLRGHRPAGNARGKERRKVIGKDIAMIFQEPIASLNPCFTVGFQLGEVLKTHTACRARRARTG